MVPYVIWNNLIRREIFNVDDQLYVVDVMSYFF